MPGIWISQMQRSNEFPSFDAFCKVGITSFPSVRASAVIPPNSKVCLNMSRLFRLSSTIRMLMPERNAGLYLLVLLSLVFLSHAVKWKVLPLPSPTLSAQTSPFISFDICLQMDRPKPVPPYFLVVEPSACWKGVKIVDSLSFGIPMPVSLIFAWSFNRSSFSSSISRESSISPDSVNLGALPIRLVSACRKRRGSPFT